MTGAAVNRCRREGCGRALPPPRNRRYCRECAGAMKRDNMSALYAARQFAGQCPVCTAPLPAGLAICGECNAVRRAAVQQMRCKRRACNRCEKCGADAGGKWACAECRITYNVWRTGRRRQLRDAAREV